MREHLRTWEEEGFRLDLFDTGETDSYGKSRLAYVFSDKGETIFEGDDFCASPIHAVDSDATIAGLLGFLSLKPGDTDSEYFDSYTTKQVAWMETRAEDLSTLVYDLERSKRFIVIENTPGYLPEDDAPFITDDYAAAVEYMNERAASYADDPDGSYRLEVGWASPNNYAAVMVYDDSKSHDLGRYIGVELYEGDDDDDV